MNHINFTSRTLSILYNSSRYSPIYSSLKFGIDISRYLNGEDGDRWFNPFKDRRFDGPAYSIVVSGVKFRFGDWSNIVDE